MPTYQASPPNGRSNPIVEATEAHPIALWRLYVLRAMYLIVVAGLGTVLWPGIVHQQRPWELMEGIVKAMLAAFSLLCLLGLRYPLQMIPILLWELIWKSLWLMDVALPAWRQGHFDEGIASNTFACGLVVIVPFVLPWRYLFRTWFRHPSNPWR